MAGDPKHGAKGKIDVLAGQPMCRFEVPGGHIDVRFEKDGTLRVHGVAEYGSHNSRLTIIPASANDVIIHLTPSDHHA